MTEIAVRRLFRVVNGGTPTSDEVNWNGEIPWATPVDLATVDGRSITTTARTLTRVGVQSGSATVPEGSLLVSTRAPIGYVAATTAETAFNQGCRGLVPRLELDLRFFRYQLLAKRDELVSRGQGSTFAELSSESLAALKVRCPEPDEQREIADFLDAETARIDALIEKKQRMIELASEALESEVYYRVTRGLDESAQRKPVHLSWIGEMPEHWGLPAVGARYEVQLGKMLNPDAAAGPSRYPYLRNVNVQWDRIDTDDLLEMHFDAHERQRLALRAGDLLVCEGGEVGRAAVWQGQLKECYFQKALHRVRPRTQGNTRFLMYCLRAAAHRNVFAIEGNQSTIVHLTAEQLRVHRLPWPPPAEQAAIVEHLDRVSLLRDQLKTRLLHQISLLRERRQALITAAVTGELDLAKAAA